MDLFSFIRAMFAVSVSPWMSYDISGNFCHGRRMSLFELILKIYIRLYKMLYEVINAYTQDNLY